MPTFDELLAQAKQRGEAQRAAILSQASATNPDAYAEQRRQATLLGVPTAAVTAIPEEMGARAKQAEIDTATANAPVLRLKYTDADFARLGQDEPGVLSQIEQAVGKTTRYFMGADEGGGLPGAVYRQGWLGAKVAGAGLGRAATEWANWAISPVVGQDNAVGRLALRFAAEGAAATKEQEDSLPGSSGMLRQMADSGFGSAAQMAKYLPMAALGPGGIAAALVGMSVEQGGTTFQTSRDKGVPLAQATLHGVADTMAEYVTEKYIGGAKFLENLVTGQGFKKIAASMGIDAAGEAVAQVWQNFNEWMIANPGKSAEDFIKEQPEQMAIAAGASVIGGTAQSVTYKAAARVVEAATGNARRIADAEDDAKSLADLFKAAASSKLLQRAPDTLAQFVQQAADHHPKGIKAAYIDAQTLGEVLQQTEMRIEDVAPSVTPEAFAEALASNGTVELPIGDLVASAAGKPIEAALLPNLRTSADGLSEVEAKKAQTEAQKLVEDHAQEVLKSAELEAKLVTSRTAVRDDILKQLNDVGRFTPEQNTVKATLAAAFLATQGAREGLTAEEFYAKHPLRIQASGRASDAIDQGGGLTLEGYRYGKTDRTVIAPVSYGAGLRGSGYEEIMAHPDKRIQKRVYFYADKGTGINPEAGVGGRGHKAQLTNVYDGDQDPLRLKRGVGQYDFESRVIDAGYSGYLSRMGGTQSAQVIMLGDQQIPAQPLGALGKTKGTVVPPPAPRPSIGRDIAGDAVRANKGFPSGELSRERWGTLIKALEPAAYEEMKAAGVFEGEGKFYKDGLVADFESKTQAPDYSPFAQRAMPDRLIEVAGIAAARVLASSRKWASNRDFKMALQAAVRAAAGSRDLTKDTPANREYIASQLLKEAREALITNSNAVGWYDDKVTTALEIVSLVHPELKTDEQSKFAFIWALAVTSNGVKVDKNFSMAEDAYAQWKASDPDPAKRTMPTSGIGIGPTASKIHDGLRTYNLLMSRWGFERTKAFATTLQPNRDVLAAFGRKVSGEGMDTQVYGAGVLGPKIGNGFFMNLYGEFGQLTMDRWWVRMWGRITGDLVEVDRQKIAASRASFVAVIDLIKKDKEATRAVEQAIGTKLGKSDPTKMAKAIFKATDKEEVRVALAKVLPATPELEAAISAARGKAKDFVAVGDELRKAAKSYYVNLDGQIEVPGGSRRRDMMREVSQTVLAELRKENPALTMADFQALMWYPEKTLYDSAGASEDSAEGYEDDEAPDYANAAASLAKQKGVNDEQIADAIKRARSDIEARQLARRSERGTVELPAAAGAGPREISSGGFEQRGLAPASLDDFTAENLPGLLSKDGWAVLTAEDPNATKASPEENAAAQARLKADLDAMGATYIDAVGKYGDVQGALIVTGITEDQALQLGRKYGQESVLTRSGLVYSADGHVIPATGMQVFDKAPDDFYTEVPSTGGYFSVELDWDNPIPGPEQVFNQTDTEKLDAWYGEESNLRNPDGTPLLLYHGTTKAGKKGIKSAEQFKRSTYGAMGPAVYLGDSAEASAGYDGGAMLKVYARGKYLTNMQWTEYVSKHGWKGAEEAATTDGWAGVYDEKFENAVAVWNPANIKDASAKQFKDDGTLFSQQTRGTFSPSTKTITLLATANLSTFTHELGHYFLDTLAEVAAQPDAPARVVEDMNKLLAWFGVPDLASWRGMSVDQQRPHHEQLAEGFEAYIFEGKAPSESLKPTFQRLREFMVAAYKSLAAFMRSHNVKLNSEVRGVFDRMIASEEEIAAAERAAQYRPLFASAAEAGMSEEEYQRYIAIGDDGTRAAVDEMTARSMRDLARTRAAHERVSAQLRGEIEAQRKEVRAEVVAEVNSMPVYQAERWLRTGKVTGEDNETLKTWHGGRRLNDAVVNEMYPEAASRSPGFAMALQGLTQKDGMHPDLVAATFGFADGRALIDALVNRQPRQALIEAMVDERMLQEHGEMTTPEGIARAADEAVHNDARARALANELKMLREANSPQGKTPAGGSVNVLLKAAKEFAATIANRTLVGKLNPRLHVAAEQRAAKKAAEASAAKKPQEAIAAKRDQLLNFHAAQAVRNAAEEVRKMRTFFDRVLKGNDEKVVKGGRDPDVVNAARAVLSLYGLGGKPAKTASEYVDLVKKYDPEMGNVLADAVTAAEANAKPFEKLTVEEARALTDEVQVLWVLAKRSRMMEVAGDLVDREVVQAQLKDRLVEIGIPDVIPGEGKAVTTKERALRHLKDFAAAARRVESWVGGKDGASAFGPFRRYVWQPVKDAATRYHTERAVYRKAVIDLIKPIAPTLGRRIVKADELGYEFGYSSSGSAVQEIVHAILHTGNDSNKRKLLLGRGWATQNADGTLDTTAWDTFIQRMIDEGVITKAHYDFAQGVWDLLEQTKPAAQATHRAVFGRYFKEVTANAFTTPFGTYRGGYVPAITDAAAASDAATRKLMEDENASMQFAFPSTSKGFTKSRVEYNSKLLLDLNALTQHIDKVLLFTHMEQPVRDVRRILTAKEVAGPLNRIDPSAMNDLLTPWLNRAARQIVETPATTGRGAMRLLTALRRNVGASIMFANLANAAQQVTGLATASAMVKPKYLRTATAAMIAHPGQTIDQVVDASPYMKQRLQDEMNTLTGEVQDILVNPSLMRKAHDWTLRNAYFLQRAVDYATTPIVWKAAYNESIVMGLDEDDAVARADGVVRETQGSQAPEGVSNIETGNAFIRMFTQFSGYFNMSANLMATAFVKGQEEGGLRKGLGRAVFVLPAVVLVPAILGELISQLFKGGPPDEDDDGEYLDDWMKAAVMGTAKYMAAMVPGAGGVLAAALGQLTPQAYDDRMAVPPAVQAIERAVKLPGELAAAVAEGGHKAAIAVRELGALLGAMGIIAAPAVAKRVAYGIDVAGGEVEPTGPIDATRGVVTGTASSQSRGQ